ncbi:hypothetical protein BOTBODRAFT_28684 [Botryobasidium botryosum FD-172 SS1]|uniref:Major facilitator superfamily (MFS) profile domain-containing protein n=1 Tax=Botryobasidium botryosum (strain FD-172 SS1) TaxID=930990 RepID=A0A067MWW6_BOTB1|nr:hypothetical protein BOTBODRAFT_28684 [Botryobasidium botryosum FD-172 SS1]
MNSSLSNLEANQPSTSNAISPVESTDDKASTHKTIVNMAELAQAKKYGLLLVFVLAQFLDAASNSMLFPAIPFITADLNFTGSQSAWLFAAYQATFAAFLLISGRISDIYSPKPIFIVGNILLGVMALGAGFVKDKIGLLVLRAFCGIGAAFTIPSALNLIVRMFPNPREQSRAISFFGSAGALGNVGGLLLGGILVQYTTWHWIFFLITMIAVPIGIVCFVFIPEQPRMSKEDRPGLDAVGVTSLTVAIILFVLAVTSGSNDGWNTALFIAPLILAVLLTIGFFVWEKMIDEKDAALPPRLWFYPNFGILFGVALFPVTWYIAIFLLLPPIWQGQYHWSAIMTAVRFLPVGVGAGIVSMFSGYLPFYFRPKHILLTGLILDIVPGVLLPFATSESRYWSIVFPAFLVGTVGTMVLYTNVSIAFFKNTPPEVAGTVGAVFNAALQLGSALAVAAITSIQTSIDARPGNEGGYSGTAASFWFILALTSVEIVGVLVFYRSSKELDESEAGMDDIEKVRDGGDREEGEEGLSKTRAPRRPMVVH